MPFPLLGFLIPGWLKLIPLAIVGAALVTGALYIKGVIDDNAQLEANQAKFEISLDLLQGSNEALQHAIAARDARNREFQKAIDDLTAKSMSNRAELRNLATVLAAHDITGATAETATAIEQIINTDQTATIDQMMEASGATAPDPASP